ncbi:MBL fold metallo-hydrolase [Robiginitalea sp. SC105]|uniref:MBL fold metallo-hydrolase n=1 Tax=Robiginitalea sp. SC105 TaxID=2762332 RepID=UPI00163AECAE|nr:MBL fold metallo-hydrolase [Robiginitalea sp. SC105]MBC2838997.1 MBL fold metallo-hydrolase [Robiginitalea sp. SC105]
MRTLKTLLLPVALLIVQLLPAQRDWDQVQITPEKVTDNLYVLFGAGGNIGLALGEEYAYVIDDQFAQLTDKILAAIRGITDKPVRFVVNTHWHGDHVGGNENLAAQGAILVAHENVRKRMNSRTDRGDRGVSEPAPYGALSKITFSEEMTIHLGPDRSLHLMYVDPAHTDGDSYSYFPQENAIHMGDNFVDGYPFIDISSGGDIDGLIRNLNMALFIVDDQTKIIPGHGPVMGRTDLIAFRDMLSAIRTRVKQARDSGKSLEEVQAMGLTKEWDAAKGQGFIGPAQIVQFAFETAD